jgi:hypothetical protein
MRSIVAAAAVFVLAAATACDGGLHVARADNAALSPVGRSPVASAPLDGQSAAELHVSGGLTTIDVTSGAIGNDLFRATTAPGSGQVPVAAVTGNVVSLAEHGISAGNGLAAIAVILNPRVTWSISLDGGASSAVLDLSGAHVAAVDLTQGVSFLEVTLPAASGTTRLAIAAGASQVQVHLHGTEPVRATLSAGAGSVTLDGVTHSGIAAGTSFATAGWDAAAQRVDIECSSGVSTIVIDRV